MKNITLFLLMALLAFGELKAASGDTTMVQAFTFGSPQDSVFKFPDHSKTFRKVLMYYTLKCNPKQSPACGEWDYLTYTYLYQKTGKYDSVVNKIDTTFDTAHNVLSIDTTWGLKEKLERYELGRFITPYGVNLDLGKGFTWVYDVSDYESLLHDSVHLSAGNWQELLDVKFAFIEGTPTRQPFKVVNIWSGNFNYGTQKTIEELMGTKKITIDGKAAEVNLKVRVTGHGFGGTDNCSEFCPRNHSIAINGNEAWEQLVWRDNCGQNPVYPQGGTWVYNRSNWCPGAEVYTYNQEITNKVTPNNSTTFEYHVDPYTWNNVGSVPYYAIEAQLIYYNSIAPDSLDAAMEEIVTPSTADIQRRKNPICSNPEIVVSNQSHTAIRSLLLEYGVSGGSMMKYTWNGIITYQSKQDILLPSPIYSGSGFPNFVVRILEVNGQTDKNKENNVIYSQIPMTQLMPREFIINLRTNAAPEQNSYTLKDADGHILYSREGMAANTLYRDTVRLGNTCYTFELLDEGDNGLAWWAAPSEGNGYLRFTDLKGKIVKGFNADFGSGINLQFNTGFGLSIEKLNTASQMKVYPNPSKGKTMIDFQEIDFKDGKIDVMDANGKVIIQQNVSSRIGNSQIMLPGKGLYIIRLITDRGVYISKAIGE